MSRAKREYMTAMIALVVIGYLLVAGLAIIIYLYIPLLGIVFGMLDQLILYLGIMALIEEWKHISS